MYPRKLKRTVDNDQAWDEKGVTSRKKRHVNKEATSLETILQVISNNNPSFATNILTRITTNNTLLQSAAASNDNTHVLAVCKNIVESVRGFTSERLANNFKTEKNRCCMR